MFKVGEVARIKLKGALIGSLVLWSFLFSGNAVIGLVLSYGFQTLIYTYFLGNLLKKQLQYLSISIEWKIPDRTVMDLFTQGKLALSYFLGYISSAALVPFFAKYYGLEVAAKMGLAIAIAGNIASLVSSLVYAAAPSYGAKIALSDWVGLKRKFMSINKIVLVVGIIAYALYSTLAYLLGIYLPEFSSRLPDLLIMVSISGYYFSGLIIGSTATLLRSFKTEPMLPASICGAAGFLLLMMAHSYLTIEHFSYGMVAVNCLAVLPITYLIYRKVLLRHNLWFRE
jgi:hypothetical protein